MKNKCIALAGASVIALSASAATLTVEDYCNIATASPASVKESVPLADGESFAAISDDEQKIEIYSYKTGKKTGVLFDINEVKGDVKISSFDGYKVSENGKKVLLWNDTEQIYRYSFRAEYYVYDIMRKTLSRVSEGGPQRGATLSHDGRMVAYMRGNNIYISNRDSHTDRAITMTHGTPQQVRDLVRREFDTFKMMDGGSWYYVEADNGFPYENLEALVNTIRELRGE